MGAVGGGRRSAVVPTADVAHAPTVPPNVGCHIRFLAVTGMGPSFRSENRIPPLKGFPGRAQAPARTRSTKEKQRPAGGDAGRCSREGTGWLEGGESQPVLNGA